MLLITLVLSSLINAPPETRGYVIPPAERVALDALDGGKVRGVPEYDAGWEHPTSCAHNPAQANCVLPRGVFAVRGKELAVRQEVERAGCTERDDARVFTMKAPGMRAIGTRDGRAQIDGSDNRAALWTWVAKLKDDGFNRAENLLSSQLLDDPEGRGAQVTRLVRLGGGLSKFLLRVDPKTRKLWLASSLDDGPVSIGRLPVGAARLEGIVVTDDGRHFVMWGTLSDGSRCGVEPTFVRAYQVPLFARLTLGTR